VIGTVSNDSKASLIKQYGADDAINYATLTSSCSIYGCRRWTEGSFLPARKRHPLQKRL
jgi:hypothetical protein